MYSYIVIPFFLYGFFFNFVSFIQLANAKASVISLKFLKSRSSLNSNLFLISSNKTSLASFTFFPKSSFRGLAQLKKALQLIVGILNIETFLIKIFINIEPCTILKSFIDDVLSDIKVSSITTLLILYLSNIKSIKKEYSNAISLISVDDGS